MDFLFEIMGIVEEIFSVSMNSYCFGKLIDKGKEGVCRTVLLADSH